MAPLLLSYGKALYEVAFTSQGVMGQTAQPDQTVGGASSDVADEGDVDPSGSGKFVFEEAVLEGDGSDDEGDEAGPSGSAEGNGNGDGDDDAQKKEQGEEEGEEGREEPEDDYNAAWEVLDLARRIYAKSVEGKGDEVKEEKLCLAECYDCLGDVSLETGTLICTNLDIH
jgi:HAT1-interacting factor 1